GALGHLQALLADDPLQEHHHRALMHLHAACGRREAALAQYAQCRERLAQELGVTPTAETQALATRLRHGESATHGPTLATPANLAKLASMPPQGSTPLAASPAVGARPTLAWPRQMPLVGRSAAWAQLQAAWDAGRVIVIQGDGGIGKSRLACDFAASHGAYALAQCRRSDAGVPYASFTRALRQLAGPALAQADLPGWVRLELAHVLPELGQQAQRIGSVQEQRRFFEACATAWQTLSAGSFDAIVIDDWHLADDASRALLGFIAEQRGDRAGSGSNAAREIFVLRPELDSAAQARLRALLDSTQALHLVLPPLEPEHVFELVRQLSGAPAPHRFAQRLERATGGNPFFVAETLRQWLGLQLLSVGPDGIWQTPFDNATQDYGELPVPDSVRDTVIARVQRLSDPVRRLLEAAALATEPFTPTLLAGACGLSELEALGAIEDAMAAEMLREREGGYGFAHDLVQAALDSALAPQRRRLGHRRLALGAQAAGMAPADIAHHWEAGGEPQRAVPLRIAAAEAALALYADAEAERHWQAAQADGPTLAQQMQILGGRWRLLRQREDQPGLMAAVAALDALGQQARATPGAGQVAQDAAVNAAEILALTNRSAEAVQRLRTCLDDPALGVALRAQALRVLSQALSREGRTDEARQATEQALAAGGLTPLQQGGLLHALSYTCFLQGQPGDALSYARRALVCWQSAGARRLVARAHASIGRALDMLDEQQSAWSELERAYQLAAELKLVDLQREVANNLANNRVNLGEPARAKAVIQEAWALSPHFAMPSMPVFYLGILVQAHYQLGELGQALTLSDDALARAQALGEGMTLADCATMTLPLHTLLGDHAGAARRLAALQGLALD
ncbi:MAG: AAA family ATPase, partial [Rubrivivax sp.]|nr:AAA family ATPase [Rubrivivax sp.]